MIEGIDLRALEYGLDGCQANTFIAKILGKRHECGKAMCMTARTPVLKEVQYCETLSELGQGQGAPLLAIFIDPTDMLERRGWQPHNSHLHGILHERARGVEPRAQVC
ncbi:hypothetical protein GCM10007276_26890 [Agaricicola taiwanensis]|uniref:Uncharacterized protein n=1 Tax=Agaricicola taiwanensis TaxID=591372 RepID=A0A8J2YJS2_9RHOB|nr:hypothetical protein GCM10007276_26890 [Agaricicola taiwanensis]